MARRDLKKGREKRQKGVERATAGGGVISELFSGELLKGIKTAGVRWRGILSRAFPGHEKNGPSQRSDSFLPHGKKIKKGEALPGDWEGG